MSSKKIDFSAIQTASVSAAAALYVLGAFVTSIHLSRLGIYELPLAKITYFFAGATCAFYLFNRLLITTLVLDYRYIYKSFTFPSNSMAESAAEKLSGKSELLRHTIVRQLALHFLRSSSAFLVVYPLFVITLPVLVIYARIFDFSDTNVELIWLGKPVPTAIILISFQALIILVFLLKRLMSGTLGSRRAWKAIVSVMTLAEIVLYTMAIHPIVRPAFGGGRAAFVSLIPKDEASAKTLAKYMNNRDNARTADTFGAFVFHETTSHLYVSTQFKLDYSSPNLSHIIEHGPIFRLNRDLLSGFVINLEPDEITGKEPR